MSTIAPVSIKITRSTRADLRTMDAVDADVQNVSPGEIYKVHPDVALELIYADAAVYPTDEELAAADDKVDVVQGKAARKKLRSPAGGDK